MRTREKIGQEKRVILYVKHVATEGPETLGDFFVRQGLPSRTIDLWRGDPLPEDLSSYQAVIVLGGPMNVYEEDKYPFLRKENQFIQRIVAEGVPYLGLCLGAQLLAKASGAQVVKSPEKEVGFSDIQLTSSGKKDFLFQGVRNTIRVFQWHEDMFLIPSGSENLASSPACPYQAFRVGKSAYGLQFHVEISDKTIQEWTQPSSYGETERLKILRDGMLQEYAAIKREFDDVAKLIYQNFFIIMRTAARTTKRHS